MSDTTPPPPPSENPYGAGANPPPPPAGQPGSSYPTGPSTPGDAVNQPGGYPAAPPPPPYAGPGARPGELMDRFLARLIDGVLLFFVNAVVLVPIVIGAVGMDSAGMNTGFGGGSFAVGALSAVISTAIYLGYFSFMESSRGQTIGKMVMKLHVQTVEGAKPTLEQAAKRNIWVALPLLGVVPIIGGIVGSIAQLVVVIMIAVQISNDTVARAPWTDKFAGTRVIKQG